MQTFKVFCTALVGAAVLDLGWMTLVARAFYKNQLGELLRADLAPRHWVAVVVIYIIIAAGVVWFVLPHAHSVLAAGWWGAAFGLVLYGLYEATNYALLAGWPLSVAIVDTLWGAVICGLTSMAAFWIGGVMR